MTQYNTLNVKLLNLQLNKLKSGIKNNNEILLKFTLNIFGDSNDENNSKDHQTFANDSSANIKLSKTQLHKTG